VGFINSLNPLARRHLCVLDIQYCLFNRDHACVDTKAGTLPPALCCM
jgi:hypothetical protein